MSVEFDSLTAGGQVQVTGDIAPNVPALPAAVLGGGTGIPPKNGSLWVDGVSLFGSPLNYPIPGVPEATMMVGGTINPSCLIPPPISIFKITNKGSLAKLNPLDVMIGDPGVGMVGITVNSTMINGINLSYINLLSPITSATGVLNWVGAKMMAGVESLFGVKGQAGQEARAGGKVDNGARTINGALTVNGRFHVNGRASWISSIVGTRKKFDIEHPSKEGYRLSHGCLEGPEHAVFYRGKLRDGNVIELPAYWRDLVHTDSITVQLTPVGGWQELFVKSIDWGQKVIVGNNSGGQANCDFVVHGTRKDIKHCVVEYEGSEANSEIDDEVN